MQRHSHHRRLAERSSNGGADEDEYRTGRLVRQHVEHVEQDGDDRSERGQHYRHLACDVVAPCVAEETEKDGRQIEEKLVVHEVGGGHDLDGVLAVRYVFEVMTGSIVRKLLLADGLVDVKTNGRLQRRLADFEEKENSLGHVLRHEARPR